VAAGCVLLQWGLWGIECQTYNMLFLGAMIVGVEHAREIGVMAPVTTELSDYISVRTVGTIFMLFCLGLIFHTPPKIMESPRSQRGKAQQGGFGGAWSG
jgi:hypothetical protein